MKRFPPVTPEIIDAGGIDYQIIKVLFQQPPSDFYRQVPGGGARTFCRINLMCIVAIFVMQADIRDGTLCKRLAFY